MAASLGSLFIELAANTARLQSDMGKAIGIVEKTAAKFKTAFKFAGGGLLGAALVGAVKQSIDFGDAINKASIKAGIGNKAMSELAYAAKLADVDIASLSTALKKMQVSLSEAGTGAKGPTTALAALGLTIAEVRKLKPETQFEILADRISKLKDPADRARAATELFGKAGADLLPLFEQGAAGIAKARQEAEKLGLSFSEDQIKKLAAADDSIKRLDASWKGLATTLTSKVAGPLATVLDMLSGMDTRGVDSKIEDLEKKLGILKFNSGAFNPEDQARMRAELSRLKAEREFGHGNPSLGGRTGIRGQGSVNPVGFAAADAVAKAEEAAKKAGEAALKEEEKMAKEREDLFAHTDENISQHYYDELEERAMAQIEFDNEVAEASKELAEKTAIWREEQAKKLSEGAQVFKDAFLNAWDDMVNTGKFKWDELLKYMIAEFARRGIVKLFDSLFAGKSGGGGAGWLGTAAKFVGGLFGGGRANGGPMQSGKFYEVGERGRELFAPGMNGTMIPNHALGGSINAAPVINIDARGATVDAIKLLERMAPRIIDAAVAKTVDGIRRNAFAL